ncbi:UNKNOWN [Stylonychia lemnae]|uniref:Malectin domain-containing protein n=1 Tax=Stylonychia lemnae TaxID=5949 RepID=A0A078AMR2_STYLE|nr:UNKNOWN [Stylonychia lemnae]|eukprot:CDW83206.1 UNKNOWN [Stylonychia lemnae]
MRRISLFIISALFGIFNRVQSQGYDRQALAGWFLGLNPEKVVYAVNCGSNDEATDMIGVRYMPDQGFTGGVASEDGVGHQWLFPNSDIYHSERYGANEGFKYHVPLPKEGQYALVLKFSEVYFQEPGQKIFDIKIGKKTIVPDLDIFGKVFSRAIPYDTFTEFKVKDGKIFVQGEEVQGAVKNGKFLIDFVVGKADNPKVNAILIVEGGLKNTHHQAHERYLKELDKIRKLQDGQATEPAEQQQQEMQAPFSSNIDFFADDEDLSQPKGQVNSLLESPYMLEGFSIGFLILFFGILNVLTTENENALVSKADLKRKRD